MEETGCNIYSKVNALFFICLIEHHFVQTHGCCGGENLLPISGIEPRFIGRSARSIVSIWTVLSRLHLFVVRFYTFYVFHKCLLKRSLQVNHPHIHTSRSNFIDFVDDNLFINVLFDSAVKISIYVASNDFHSPAPRCGTVASVAFILWRVKQAANKLCWLASMCNGQRGSTIDH
jgi:hypothetical protein